MLTWDSKDNLRFKSWLEIQVFAKDHLVQVVALGFPAHLEKVIE